MHCTVIQTKNYVQTGLCCKCAKTKYTNFFDLTNPFFLDHTVLNCITNLKINNFKTMQTILIVLDMYAEILK
jgi:hypothetical protein